LYLPAGGQALTTNNVGGAAGSSRNYQIDDTQYWDQQNAGLPLKTQGEYRPVSK